MLSIQKIGDTTGTVCISVDNEKYTVEVWTPDKTRTYTYSKSEYKGDPERYQRIIRTAIEFFRNEE